MFFYGICQIKTKISSFFFLIGTLLLLWQHWSPTRPKSVCVWKAANPLKEKNESELYSVWKVLCQCVCESLEEKWAEKAGAELFDRVA